MSRRTSFLSHRVLHWLLIASTLPFTWAADRASAQTVRLTGSYPSLGYFTAFTAFHDGDFQRALEAFQAAGRGGLRSSEGAWVDTICYRTMMGECYYRLGNIKSALEHYSAALKLFRLQPDWMLRVEWPAAIRPYTRSIRPPITWAAGTRPAQIGQIPDRFRILVGNLNNEDVVRRGGVLAPPEYQSINVYEVVRCTTLAMRRRYELMGPVCEFDPLTNELVATYDLRLTEPNHWSQAWINVQRGYALAAAGNFAEAETSFRASVVLGGQWDHPLTPMAILGLAQMAMEQDRLPEAGKLFIDASVAAAVFEQPELVEDALRYAQRHSLGP